MKDFVPVKKWSIRQNIAYWFFINGKENIYQRFNIPHHIIKGIYYGYRITDIFEFCICCWTDQSYPFARRRPDLRRWHNMSI
ncbi:hypothetical protein KAR91_04110 [Candidatus Pacearchaeota archaeon]|nr:hypothetical protein [Candidatus Pacearchaeota archaeon]